MPININLRWKGKQTSIKIFDNIFVPFVTISTCRLTSCGASKGLRALILDSYVQISKGAARSCGKYKMLLRVSRPFSHMHTHTRAPAIQSDGIYVSKETETNNGINNNMKTSPRIIPVDISFDIWIVFLLFNTRFKMIRFDLAVMRTSHNLL